MPQSKQTCSVLLTRSSQNSLWFLWTTGDYGHPLVPNISRNSCLMECALRTNILGQIEGLIFFFLVMYYNFVYLLPSGSVWVQNTCRSLIHPLIYPPIHSATFTDALSLLEPPPGTRRAETSHRVPVFTGSKLQSSADWFGCRPRCHNARFQSPALSLTSWVTVDKSLHLSDSVSSSAS